MRALPYLVTLAIAGCSYTAPGGSSTDPADPDDARPADTVGGDGLRKPITISGAKLPGTVTSFPVWFDVTDPELVAAAADGSDLYFTDAAGAVLPHELRSWDPSTGHLTAFFRAAELTQDQDMAFYLRYGGAPAPAQDPAAVFSAYAAVWHLDDPLLAATVVDSRGIANGTAIGMSAARQVPGQLGGGFDFDGSTMQVTFDNMITGNTSSTISAWVRQRNPNGMDSIVTLGNSSQNSSRFLYAVYSNNHVGAGLYGNDWNDAGPDVRNSGFALLHWTLDGQTGNSTLYRDGKNPTTHSFGTTITTSGTTGAGWIGFSPGAWGNNHLNGVLDEVRIARTALTAEWAEIEYENQHSPSTFYTIDAAQPVP